MTICCPHCLGSGRTPLSLDLQAVLACVKRLGTASVRDVVCDKAIKGCSITIHQRLLRLKTLGLVSRQRRTRGFIYSIAPTNK